MDIEEKVDKLIKKIDGTIAKSRKTREMVDEPGMEGGFLEHHAVVAKQEAKGEDGTGLF